MTVVLLTFTEAGTCNSLGRQGRLSDATAAEDASADDQERESGVEGLTDGQRQMGEVEQHGGGRRGRKQRRYVLPEFI